MRDLLSLPKAHLHVHLESAVRWSTLREIGSANSVAVPEHLSRGRATFDGFRHFADQNALVRACLRRPEDFRRIAVEFCEDEAAQGTAYAEVTVTAAAHGERLLQLEMPLEAVLEGLAEGQRMFGIECRVILDHSRRRSVERAWNTLRLAERYAADGVVGIGIAGEESYPLTPFAKVFEAAEGAGLRLAHHAGETCGPVSIREALTVGRADRLGHGIRALDDPGLVAELRDRRVPLEVCPSSNVALGLTPSSLPDHPLRRLREAGLVVTVNTDIPSIVGTTLTEEYVRVRDAFGYDERTMADIARAGVEAAFASDATKARLHHGIESWLSPST